MVADLTAAATPVIVHRLTSANLGATRALNSLFAEAFEDHERYAGNPPSDEWLVDCLGRDGIIVLVAQLAEGGGAIAGGLVAYELPKLERHRCEIYLYDIAVAANYRRRGIASQMIRQLQDVARARGASSVYVQADPDDEPAVALYAGLGRRADVLHFDLLPEHVA